MADSLNGAGGPLTSELSLTGAAGAHRELDVFEVCSLNGSVKDSHLLHTG